MKQLIVLLFVIALFVSACNQSPTDIPEAGIEDSGDTEEGMEEESDEEGTDEDPTDDMGDEGIEDHDNDMEDSGEETDVKEAGEVAIDPDKSSFEFQGYKPGSDHAGTFDEWEGVLLVEDGKVIGGKGTITAASVNTGIDGLDKHLRADDFFDVEQCPTIAFEAEEYTDGMVRGPLTFHCVTHEVTFPATVTETGVSAEFLLDTTPFGMTNLGVDKDVRIAFDFQI